VLEITPDVIVLDGETIAGSLDERVRRFRQWIGEWARETRPSPGSAKSPRPVLYVAAPGELEIRMLRTFVVEVPEGVELRLLVRPESPLPKALAGEVPEKARELSARLLVETDPEKRRALAREGYATSADCAPLSSAVAATDSVDAKERWPALKHALPSALAACACDKLDTTSLTSIVGAEQRAGAASVAYLPLSFVRDERCDATMPQRAVKKLVRQLEEFDATFSGAWQRDALTFGDVLVDDRLRVYFCDALPGETLAAKERARATLYLRVPGGAVCEPWAFEPIAPGSPMGTFRRPASDGRPALAFHYAQAAEEIRVFGPVDPAAPSHPTDSRDFACDETFRLTSVDDESVGLDKGRWFFREAACTAWHGDVPGAPCFDARRVGSAAAPAASAAGDGSSGAASVRK
jgi:hypothetical protein